MMGSGVRVPASASLCEWKYPENAVLNSLVTIATTQSHTNFDEREGDHSSTRRRGSAALARGATEG